MESPLLLLANISMSYMGPLISALTTILTATNLMEDIIRNQGSINEPGEFAIFDFIVVGSGSAGGVIANRLSESGKFQVALLEAGGDPTALNDIPYFMTDNLNHPETDWVYRTVPQNDSSQSLRDNSIILNRGKSLGGTSNLNYMVYMRGNPKDFDNWANLTQDEGWSYENLLPYFKKSENYQGNFKNESFHGTGGPLTISTSDFAPLLRPWLEAAKEMGFHVEDPNAMQSKGFSQVENTIKNGKRCSVYEAFIKPALTRENLKVIRYAHVTRVNLDENNAATGVTYVRHGKEVTIHARNEVIVSAGAIGSPQLLMLSGIGSDEPHL
ncbi:Oxygen-dependent choline dehydrogenase [Folsomia candida]|uniref:Oxygen-dependent choline dehydrogenase n=1 Tax=Folsomia candida TaxID=158441 RepID=A0A226DV45_FOLCA|nr:Oxygen-dependent choline dehydrogenase [Folsomia candida]